MDPLPGGGHPREGSGDDEAGLLHFRWLFALAALFHLAGNPAVGFGIRSDWLVVSQAAVGLAAVLVLALPRRQAPLVMLCLTIPVSAWLEAPVVGNHWILAAVVSLGYLTAAATGCVRQNAARNTWTLFMPVGRLILLGAYGFAAFSKVNSGFLDPTTSCAVFYQDQLVTSFGLSWLAVTDRDELGVVVAAGAAAVELSIPVLLLLPRTRSWGVLLGMAFHWMLALNLLQHFWDFSAVLFACFILFLDPAQHREVERCLRSSHLAVRPVVRRALLGLGVLVVIPMIAAGSLGGPPSLVGSAVSLGHLSWWSLGTAALVLVGLAVVRVREPEPSIVRVASPVLLVIPLLVVVNGLTPYLEIKTGFGWNMYSNLRTVAGETNHLLVPHTWDVRSEQVERVSVLSSSDERLMVRDDVEFVWSEFQEYAQDNPAESVTYTRRGEVYSAASLADDPATDGAVGLIERKVLSFRAVDVSGAERCLEQFGPAR